MWTKIVNSRIVNSRRPTVLNPFKKITVIEWMWWMRSGTLGNRVIGPFSTHYACLLCFCRCVMPVNEILIGVALVHRLKWARGNFLFFPSFFLGWINVYKKPSHSQMWSSGVAKSTATRITYIYTIISFYMVSAHSFSFPLILH